MVLRTSMRPTRFHLELSIRRWCSLVTYKLFLEVRCDQGCIRAIDERIVEIRNDGQLGVLDLSFTDLSVNLGGVPIPLVSQIQFDSRIQCSGTLSQGWRLNEVFAGDFGPGWNLNFLQSEITVSHPRSSYNELESGFCTRNSRFCKFAGRLYSAISLLHRFR